MLGTGMNVIAGALMAVPVLGYVLSSFRKESPRSWINLGPVEKFKEGETSLATYVNPNPRPWDGETANIPCWVRRIKGNDFQVFAINCTHLGCPVRWFKESKLFMCPCHGGVFYEDGAHASGPPPRPLYQYEVKVENGNLTILGGQLPTLSQPV